MLAKRVKIKILFLITLLLLVSSLLFLVLKSLEDNVVYFFSPSEIYSNEDVSLNKKIRIGGLVKKDSIKKKAQLLHLSLRTLKRRLL